MSRARCSRWIFLTLVLALSVSTAWSQTGLQEIKQHVQRGRRHLQKFELGEAVAAFQRVVDAQLSGRLDLTVPGARRILTSALEGMAEAHLGLGDRDAAAQQFVAALAVSPAFEPNRERHSSKLIAIFEEARDGNIGYLDVNVRPFGSRVEINGSYVGETPLLSLPWPAGALEISVEHAGHASLTRQIALLAGGRKSLEDRLSPNARSVSFLTTPTDVTILVDGRKMAVTRGPVSQPVAREHHINPAHLSGEIVVEHLAPGSHMVRFERECYRSQEVRIDVIVDPHGDPMQVPLMILERSVGTLAVESTPFSGRVVLDGKERGNTPMTLRDVCSGRHELQVVGTPHGRWSKMVDFEPGKTERLVATLRPVLAYLGLAAGPDVDSDMLQEAQQRMNDAVSQMIHYHRILPDPADGLQRARALLPRADGSAPRTSGDAVREVALPLGADLVLVGLVRVERLRPVVHLLLYSTLHGAPDARTLHPDRLAGLESLVRAMSRPLELEEPWFGMSVVGTRQPGYSVKVVDLYLDGPAAGAGLRVGDGIVALNGKELTSLADWNQALEEMRSADRRQDRMPVKLTVRRGATDDIHMDVSWAPQVVSPGHADLLYNQQLVDLEFEASSRNDPSSRGIVRLNQAMAYIHFGRYDLALQKALAKAHLRQGMGISSGTVEYLRAWCYEQLGPEYYAEARESFQTASAADGATLETHMGPLVAPLAKQHLEALQ